MPPIAWGKGCQWRLTYAELWQYYVDGKVGGELLDWVAARDEVFRAFMLKRTVR